MNITPKELRESGYVRNARREWVRGIAIYHHADAETPVRPEQCLEVRTKSGRMNKTETAYAERLERMKQAGHITAYFFEGITLKLAHDCRYTPDFFVVTADGRMEFREVKGTKGRTYYARDDAKVKLKIAAARFDMFTFRIVWRVGGEWKSEAVPT